MLLQFFQSVSKVAVMLCLTFRSVYLFEDDPVVNRFISVPKDQSKYQNAQI